ESVKHLPGDDGNWPLERGGRIESGRQGGEADPQRAALRRGGARQSEERGEGQEESTRARHLRCYTTEPADCAKCRHAAARLRRRRPRADGWSRVATLCAAKIAAPRPRLTHEKHRRHGTET